MTKGMKITKAWAIVGNGTVVVFNSDDMGRILAIHPTKISAIDNKPIFGEYCIIRVTITEAGKGRK